VKIASARALGSLGGHEAEVVLERCIIYEKKPEVRDAAAIALRDLRDRAATPVASTAPPRPKVVPRLPDTAPAPSARRSPFTQGTQARPPVLDGPTSDDGVAPEAERVPPPPPTPVGPQ
jgi:hypothetical protein